VLSARLWAIPRWGEQPVEAAGEVEIDAKGQLVSGTTSEAPLFFPREAVLDCARGNTAATAHEGLRNVFLQKDAYLPY